MSKLFKVGIALGGLDVLALQKKEPCSGAGAAPAPTAVQVATHQQEFSRTQQSSHNQHHQRSVKLPKAANKKNLGYTLTAGGAAATVGGVLMMTVFGGKPTEWKDIQDSTTGWPAIFKGKEPTDAVMKAEKKSDFNAVKAVWSAYNTNKKAINANCNALTPDSLPTVLAAGADAANEVCGDGEDKQAGIDAYKAVFKATTSKSTSTLAYILLGVGLLALVGGAILLELHKRLFAMCKKKPTTTRSANGGFLEV